MPSLKSIRKRITSTKATQKITKAMKMVAAARLTRAQQRITTMRPYAVKTQEVLGSVAASMAAQPGSDDAESKRARALLERREEKKTLFLVMTSDRGLCGAFNTNILKLVQRSWDEKRAAGVEVVFATCGRKGREYVQRRKGELLMDFPKIYDNLDLEKARLVANWIVPRMSRGQFDSIYIVYNEFKSAITQKVTFEQLLPIEEPKGDKSDKGGAAGASAEFIYEPDPESLIRQLVPMYVEISVLRALLESQASEFGARMTAMDAATRNAKDMIGRLTLLYNRARQAAITKELMEIIGGAEALKD